MYEVLHANITIFRALRKFDVNHIIYRCILFLSTCYACTNLSGSELFRAMIAINMCKYHNIWTIFRLKCDKKSVNNFSILSILM